MPNFERRLGMSSGSLKSSAINTIRKRDEEVFKKTIKGYKKRLFIRSAKDECVVPKFNPTGHTSRAAVYGKRRPTSMFFDHEGKERVPFLLSASREPFTVTNVPFR
jgi:hypothetical protein